MERISERVEKRYINDDTRNQTYSFITDYNLYPLYDENDKLAYFLIEFEPYGFAFVLLRYNASIFNKSMYQVNYYYIKEQWQRYRICKDSMESALYEGIQWQPKEDGKKPFKRFEVDQNGNFIEYNISPFKVADVTDQKMYFLNVYVGYIPTVKKDGKYFNLISMEEFDYKDGVEYYKKQDATYLYNNIPMLQVYFHADPGDSL